MHCPNCGKELNGNPKFCGGCGTPVSQMIQQQAPVQAPVSEPVPSAIPATPVAAPEQTSMPSAPVTEPVQTAAPAAEPEKPAVSVAPVAAPAVVSAAEPAKSAFGSNEASAPATPAPTTPAPAVQTAPANVPPKKKSKLGLIIGLSAAGLVLLAGIGVAIYFALVNLSSDNGDSNRSRIISDDDETEKTEKTSRTTETTEGTVEPVVTVSDKASRTIMIYAIGSDLESEGGQLTADITEMLQANAGDVNLIIQTGGCKEYQNVYMTGGITQRFQLKGGFINELDDGYIKNASMVDPDTLAEFVSSTKEAFPADHYILVFWDHGGSVPLHFGKDEINSGYLREIDMADALSKCDIEFESIIFDCCLMGSLEVAKALDPYTEYVVAAESSVWGRGLYYTDIINYLGNDPSCSADDYCEYIVRDFFEVIENTQQSEGIMYDSCMSAIDTDDIGEVFKAYESFIAALDNRVFNQGGYSEYVQIREDCGAFGYTESVDLTTLAGKFLNCGDKTLEQAASKLINEVSNCVFTESNNSYTYAHGMTAYVPYSYPEAYDLARTTFVYLGYSDTTIKFYDKFVSARLYYLGYTQYAGSWYVQPADAGSTQSGQTYDISDLIVNMGNYDAIKLSSEDWDVIQRIEVTSAYSIPSENKGRTYYLGTDMQFSLDNNDYVIMQNPTKWVYIEGFGFVTCKCLGLDVTDDGKWYQYQGAAAMVNGEEAYVLIVFSSDVPNGQILGYYKADILNEEYDENSGHYFSDNDSIVFLQMYYDANTQKMGYIESVTFTYSQAVDSYNYEEIDYGSVNSCFIYDIYDVYNNVYTTGWWQE